MWRAARRAAGRRAAGRRAPAWRNAASTHILPLPPAIERRRARRALLVWGCEWWGVRADGTTHHRGERVKLCRMSRSRGARVTLLCTAAGRRRRGRRRRAHRAATPRVASWWRSSAGGRQTVRCSVSRPPVAGAPSARGATASGSPWARAADPPRRRAPRPRAARPSRQGSSARRQPAPGAGDGVGREGAACRWCRGRGWRGWWGQGGSLGGVRLRGTCRCRRALICAKSRGQ